MKSKLDIAFIPLLLGLMTVFGLTIDDDLSCCNEPLVSIEESIGTEYHDASQFDPGEQGCLRISTHRRSAPSAKRLSKDKSHSRYHLSKAYNSADREVYQSFNRFIHHSCGIMPQAVGYGLILIVRLHRLLI